jgi:23S rRNA (pseudouridine1915-N3)-methyltransferase
MKIEFLFVGSTKTDYVEDAMQLYLKRLQRFTKVEVVCTPNLKGIKQANEQRTLEAEQILKYIRPTDIMALLDEKGKTMNSVKFAKTIESYKNQGGQRMVFIICGAFGADESLKTRANIMLSLSQLTFSHQLARVVLAEQVYRAYTIINNHPYHNEG